MKFLKKLKSSNFWISMISAVVLILQAVFNVEIKTEYLSQIIMSILGLLVMSGIVTDVGSESAEKKDIDMEGLKNDITTIIGQISSKFETDIIDITKQFAESNKTNTNKEDCAELQTSNTIKNNEVVDSAVTSITEIPTTIVPIQTQVNIETSTETSNV